MEQIEREHSDIAYKNLDEIRCNMAFRYENESQNYLSKNKTLKVLDEVQENINDFTKKIPLDNTSSS